MKVLNLFLLPVFALVLIFGPSFASANENPPEMLSISRQNGSYLEFEKLIQTDLGRVKEFQFIKEWAEKRGIRAYLFGGAAEAFAVYCRWAEQYELGARDFSADRLDFSIVNIFHFNQDIDIVVDAKPQYAEELQHDLEMKFPYKKTTGGKTISVWEVRPLQYSIGFKADILNNEDFKNQNTDSGSTGLIEITDPTGERSRIQDLRKFRRDEGLFFHDVARGEITYFNTGLHHSTSRSSSGNPVVISALRFLIKVFEYGLKPDRNSLKVVERILRTAPFSKIKTDPQYHGALRWIEKNANKLINNALDVNAAWADLNRMGVRKDLSTFGSRSDTDSLAWLMEQKPLPAFSLGGVTGATAGELGIKTAYMKINDFETFERLRMGKLNAPNLLLPDQKTNPMRGPPGIILSETPVRKPGEIWVGFEVNPRSVQNKDFSVLMPGIISVYNRNSLSLIPETLNISRENLTALIARNADPDFIDYVIRRYNLFTTLNESEYLNIKDYLDNDENDLRKEKYSALLIPLVANYEWSQALTSPETFISYVKNMMDVRTLNKPQIAQIVVDNLDLIMASHPGFDQLNELKTLVRHGPPFIEYMKKVMRAYVRTPSEYVRLIQFDQEDPTPKYERRMSAFVAVSFAKFLELHPNREQLRQAIERLQPDARKTLYKQYKNIFENHSCADLLIGHENLEGL